MAENKFQVLSESTPTRCDICHQTDMFDTVALTCARCQGLIVSPPSASQPGVNYREWQVTLSNSSLSLPGGELLRLVRDGLRLYWNNLLVLIGTVAIIDIPMRMACNWIFIKGWSYHYGLLGTLFSWLVPLIFTSLISGALIKTALDSYRGESVNLIRSYRTVLSAGPRYLFTSLIGTIYQFMGLLACYVGALYTYPRGAFASEIALVEARGLKESLRRSQDLGRRNSGMLILLGGLNWLAITVGSSWLWSTLLLPIFIDYIPSILGQFLTTTIIEIFLLPLFICIKFMLYIQLRIRDGESIVEASEPPSEAGKTFRIIGSH